MKLEELDYAQYPDIKKKLRKLENSGWLSVMKSLLRLPETKVYLVHEFEIQGFAQIVVIIKWLDGMSQKYYYQMCIWDKEKALK